MGVSSAVSHTYGAGSAEDVVWKGEHWLPPKEGKKKQPATCAQCVLEQHAGQASASSSRRANKRKQDVNNRKARRPRGAHGRRIAARDTVCESDEGEAEGAD